MHPVQKHLFATNFKDISGAQIDGKFALSDELINLGLGELLSQIKTNDSASAAGGTPSTTNNVVLPPDPREMLQLLDVKKLEYRTAVGKTILTIKASLRSPD
ncbi:MAG: hypothetical protein AAGF89_17325 [Bacteroidota bacterium]